MDKSEELKGENSASSTFEKQKSVLSTFLGKFSATHRFFFLVLALVVASLIFVSVIFFQEPETSIGKSVTEVDLKFQTLENTEVFLSDFEGQPIIVEFFATWCYACESQVIILRSVLVDHPDLQIISISVDPDDSIEMLRAYSQEHSIPWVVGRDDEQRAKSKFEANLIPTIVYIDAQGIIKYIEHGKTYSEKIESWINS